MSTIRRALAASTVISVIALAVCGCGPANERSQLADQIAGAVEAAGQDGVVDLRGLFSIEWDTLYAFPGYTSDNQVDETIGISWGTLGDESRIPYDGQVLVVFLKDQTVPGWGILNAGPGNDVAVRFKSTLYFQPTHLDEAIFTAFTREKTVGGSDLFYLMPLEAQP